MVAARQTRSQPTGFPATCAYRTSVVDVQRLSPHFIRVTLADEELQHFGTGGLDQRIKLFLPRQDGTFPDLDLFGDPPASMMQWYAAWRELEEADRNPIRTYTVRNIRPWAGQIDVDFVVHGSPDGAAQGRTDTGPASAWAESAQVGDDLVVIGPDARSVQSGGGIEWDPGAARDVLLAGDETAAPAISAILEALDADTVGEAYIEVPTSGDALTVGTASKVQVHWLPRDGADLGAPLTEAVRDWGRRRMRVGASDEADDGATDLPELSVDDPLWEVAGPASAGLYAWLAGEAAVITGLRRHLVKELGISRHHVSFMGYWKRGRASA